MSNKNPYVRGNYQKLFAFWQSEKRGIITRQQMVEFGQSIGMSESEAEASATVILSPREASERGDCRGNYSAQGHVYFAEPCAKEKGEDRKFRLRWRKDELEKRTRTDAPVAKKTTKAKKVTKATKATKETKKAKTVKKVAKKTKKVTVEVPAATTPAAVEPSAPAVETAAVAAAPAEAAVEAPAAAVEATPETATPSAEAAEPAETSGN